MADSHKDWKPSCRPDAANAPKRSRKARVKTSNNASIAAPKDPKPDAVIQPYTDPNKASHSTKGTTWALRVCSSPIHSPIPSMLRRSLVFSSFRHSTSTPPHSSPRPSQEWTPQTLNQKDAAPGMTVASDGLSVASHKGYRTVRAVHG